MLRRTFLVVMISRHEYIYAPRSRAHQASNFQYTHHPACCLPVKSLTSNYCPNTHHETAPVQEHTSRHRHAETNDRLPTKNAGDPRKAQRRPQKNERRNHETLQTKRRWPTQRMSHDVASDPYIFVTLLRGTRFRQARSTY